MPVRDLLKRAPGLVLLWIVAFLVVLLIGILYAIQQVQISQHGRPDLIKSLGNAVGGVGIALCGIGVIWFILLVVLMRDSRNVWADATSIYVSRNNVLLNWYVADDKLVPNSATTAGISGAPPGDYPLCSEKFGTVQPQEIAYAPYRELLKTYYGSEKVNQYYVPPDGSKNVSLPDDLENQRKLSLAYYRFIFCTKSYFQDILNGVGIKEMTFLTPTARANLTAGSIQSSCGYGKVADTQPCVAGTGITCERNECFQALNQSIAAQCLFYDDYASIRINPSGGPQGVLQAFEIPTASVPSGGIPSPGGIQVKAP